MGAPDRIVRHLCLAASSEADLRHLLPKLDDALRCASLPDAGERLLIVRSLALGHISRDVSPQHLAQRIEQGVAHVGGRWIEGGTPAAAQADGVSFPGKHEARVRLAIRLARGELCTAWYWKLAVAEFRPAMDAAENLRRIACAMAAWPQARVALPSWLAQIAQAGAASALTAAIGPQLGEALVQRAGIRLLSGLDVRPETRGHAASFSNETVAGIEADRAQIAWQDVLLAAYPRWFASALSVTGLMPTMADQVRVAKAKPRRADESSLPPIAAQINGETNRPASAVSDLVVHQALTPSPESVEPLKEKTFATPGQARRANSKPGKKVNAAGVEKAGSRVHVGKAEQAEQTERAGFDAAFEAIATTHYPALAVTGCGGLLFLLPVLARLGIEAWSETACIDAASFAMRVFRLALQRLRAPSEDPAWLLIPAGLRDELAAPVAAPAHWSDPLLSAPKHDMRSLSEAMRVASTRDEQAAVWLCAARRWLRRGARIGLASLVLRPARLSHTATHLDMHFYANEVDMRVRRLGLDIDPGWLPWFGRIVTYHYQDHRA